jgi:uncharacterized membrane protein
MVETVEAWVRTLAHFVAAGCNFAAIVTLGIGAVMAAVRAVRHWRESTASVFKEKVWTKFAGTIALALEFALAADIADTAVKPTWEEIGQLAAIAAIRTALNLFLERDIVSTRKAAEKAQAAKT